jgi:hypothetical protein
VKRIFGVDQVTNHPVVLVELDEADLAVLRAGDPLRVELASTLSAWRPALESAEGLQVDARVDAVLSLTLAARQMIHTEHLIGKLADLTLEAAAGPAGVVPVGAAFAAVAEGWALIAGTARAAGESFAVSVRAVAAALEAAGVSLADLTAAGPDLGWCMCVCPIHRDAGMFCSGPAEVRVVLAATRSVPGPSPVWMCPACAGWWQDARPDQVVSVTAEEPRTVVTDL